MKTPLSPLEPVLRALNVHASRRAILDGERALSYAAFGQRFARLSTILREHGLNAGGHVLLIAPNSADALAAFHAVPLAGGIIVPLNPAFSDESLHFLAGHADPAVALVDHAHLPRVQARLEVLGVPTIVLGDGTLDERLRHTPAAPLTLPDDLDEDQPISINYTNGTTSNPKGVMLTHRNAFVNLANLLYHLNLRSGHVFLHALTLSHSNGWGAAWAVTAAGATHVPLPDPENLRAVIADMAVTHLCASPALIAPLVDTAAPVHLTRRVTMLLAGTRPHARLLTSLQEQGFDVLHGYGLTETSAVLTLTDPADLSPAQAHAHTRQGHPMIYGGQVRVILENGDPTPPDGRTPGEIVIRSNQIMKGYYKSPRATKKVIKDGWLHTGDLAVTHEDGRIDILDREGDLLTLAGHPFSSTQIEAVLYRHPSVHEAVVVGTHAHGGDTPTAFVTLHPGAQVVGRELLSFIAPHLPDYALPHRVHLVPELPKTASGKVLKHVLREQI
ncbi:AMP-binding protein, partial [Deinococcus sp.]|uniref:AMP-binding protein n=1 Tax=Deinococcus sp. TaxID=47478 RepID=UPI002869D62A